jgi:hypothetical protein
MKGRGRRQRDHSACATIPFVHKPKTPDRDRIVVLTGWDGWGAIVVLRDSLNPKAWGEAREHDLLSDAVGHRGRRTKLYTTLVQS